MEDHEFDKIRSTAVGDGRSLHYAGNGSRSPLSDRLMERGGQSLIGKPWGVAWALAFKCTLEHFRVPFLCSGGTLLGIIRDQALIEWDDDLDFIVPKEWLASCEFGKFRDAHLWNGSKVASKGYPIFPSASFFSQNYKATLSSFAMSRKRNLRPIYSIPKTMLSPEDFQSPDFAPAHGVEWPVPRKSKEILTHVYGKWEIPSNWAGGSFYNKSYLNTSSERKALNVLNKACGFVSMKNRVWEPVV